MFSFFDAEAIFLAFTVSMSSGDVKSISFVLFLITRPLRDVTPEMSPSTKKIFKNLFAGCHLVVSNDKNMTCCKLFQ